MNFIVNKNVDKSKWQELLAESPFSSPFQTIEFYDLYNKSENFSADVFSIEDEGKYSALAVVTIQKEKGIKSFFSRRAIIYGGVVLKSNNEADLELLLKSLKSYYKGKVIYIEIRNNFDYTPLMSIFKSNDWIFNEHLNVQLNTYDTNLESLLSNMKYNRRREIKLSIKEGAKVELANSKEEVVDLYNILDDMYKERVKLPLPDLSFFINLFNNDKVGKVFIVKHNDKIIGGSFCVFYDNMTINTLYYTGLRGYHKKVFPTHLAVYGALNYAIDNNLKMLDFMGAGKPNVDYGVRDYKLKFGGEIVEYGRFLLVVNSFLYKLGTYVVDKLKNRKR